MWLYIRNLNFSVWHHKQKTTHSFCSLEFTLSWFCLFKPFGEWPFSFWIEVLLNLVSFLIYVCVCVSLKIHFFPFWYDPFFRFLDFILWDGFIWVLKDCFLYWFIDRIWALRFFVFFWNWYIVFFFGNFDACPDLPPPLTRRLIWVIFFPELIYLSYFFAEKNFFIYSSELLRARLLWLKGNLFFLFNIHFIW